MSDWLSFVWGVAVTMAFIFATFYTGVLVGAKVDFYWPYMGLRRKPCGEILGVFVFGPKHCGILTRRRWRDGLHFRPICTICTTRIAQEQ